jgi:membrane AbrB-like protein
MMLMRTSLTFAISLIGGFSFYYLHMPLPWMLGPVAAMILWSSLLGGVPCWPENFRNAGFLVLGYLLGRPFTSEVAHQILGQFPVMMLITVLTVTFSLFMSYVTSRQTGISLASCVVGGVPGGLAQMVALGEEMPSVNISIVTFMQTVRVLAVIFGVPFLAVHFLDRGTAGPGVALQATVVNAVNWQTFALIALAVLIGTLFAMRFKIPTPYLVGPVLATCLLSVNGLIAPSLPPIAVIAAQLCIGTYMGKNINFASVQKQWRVIVPYTLFNVGIVVLFSLALGWLLTRLVGMDLVTGFLSAAPGGISEMGLTAMQVNAELSAIVAYNLCRWIFILLVMPLFLRRWLGQSAG